MAVPSNFCGAYHILVQLLGCADGDISNPIAKLFFHFAFYDAFYGLMLLSAL